MNRKQRRSAKLPPAPDPQKTALVQKVIDKALELEKLSRPEEALDILRQLLEHAPDNPTIPYNIGVMSQKLGRAEDAAHWLEQALKLDPANTIALLALAAVHLDRQAPEKAITCIEKAMSHDPRDISILGKCANLLCETGRIDEGISYFRKAQKLDPGNTAIYQSLSRLKKFTADDPDIAAMERIDQNDLSDEQKIQLGYALGKAYGDAGNHDKSFAAYLMANETKKKNLNYTQGVISGYIDRIGEIFTPEIAARFANTGLKTRKPVFVVGMPRSGTTLTEQILAAHPQVHGGGELSYFAQSLPFVENPELPEGMDKNSPTFSAALLEELSADTLEDIGKKYLEKLERLSPQSPHITNKLPFNFIWIGLIKLALPEAKIIHVRRDPVDNCFSCFKTHFTYNLPWTHDLREIASVYKSHDRLMAHWKNIFGDAVYTIQYEHLVSDQETQSRRLLEYCELPWNDSCLAFHKSERRVNTASVYQVRQPIYKDAVKRWEKYREHLRPLIEELDS